MKKIILTLFLVSILFGCVEEPRVTKADLEKLAADAYKVGWIDGYSADHKVDKDTAFKVDSLIFVTGGKLPRQKSHMIW